MEHMMCGEGFAKVQRYSNGVTNDVCAMRRVGGQRRKGSEWWNEEVGRAVAKKRRDRVSYDRYRHREWL